MKTKLIAQILFLQVVFYSTSVLAQDAPVNGVEDTQSIRIANFIDMSGNWFIAYRDGIIQEQADENEPIENQHSSSFILKRSYFTLKKDLTDVFSVRYTMDLTVDREGEDAGNVETRLKYLYLKATPKIDSKTFTGTWIEVGMVHRPWLDYEQRINTYRVQDNMFIERNRIFNSADFGITIAGNIGPKMDKTFLREVNGAMPGKYLSYSFGIYNGGGYSGEEQNNNKVISGRISTRPFAASLPELQVSGYFNTGKGNSDLSPDFNQVLGFVAYTGRHLTVTGQYHTGKGDFRALYVDPNDGSRALDNNGYSFFGEYKIGKTPFAVWARYDLFEVAELDDETKRIIGGITYKINDMIRLVLNTEHTTIDNNTEDVYELNLEISF